MKVTINAYYGGWYCECTKCGKTSEIAQRQRQARINWNKKVQNG